MDRINLQIKQFSQKSYEKRIHFNYNQSSLIAYDTFKKYKTRYENIIERNKLEKNEMIGILEKIKQKSVLANFSNLKKERLESKIINCLHFDTLLNISVYFRTIIQPQQSRNPYIVTNLQQDERHLVPTLQFMPKSILPMKNDPIYLPDNVLSVSDVRNPNVKNTDAPFLAAHEKKENEQLTQSTQFTRKMLYDGEDPDKIEDVCRNELSLNICLKENSQTVNPPQHTYALIQSFSSSCSNGVESLVELGHRDQIQNESAQFYKVERNQIQNESAQFYKVERNQIQNESAQFYKVERNQIQNESAQKLYELSNENHQNLAEAVAPTVAERIVAKKPKNVEKSKRRNESKFCSRFSDENLDFFERYHVGNIEVIKMKKIHTSNPFLFSMIFSLDTLYLNWMKSESNYQEYEANIKQFEQYLTCYIYKNVSKQKQKKYLACLKSMETLESGSPRTLVCEMICEIFMINIILINHIEPKNPSLDVPEKMDGNQNQESLFEENIEFYPLESKFSTSRKTIFIIDNCPTYLTTSNLLAPSFWNNFFRHYLEINSKLASLRELLPILNIDCTVDMKNRKKVILEIVLPTIDSLFPTA